MSSFDWNRAIEINRAALLGVVSVLFGLLSVGEAGGLVFLSARWRARVLRVLVPAEAAVRRLIFVFLRVQTFSARTRPTSDDPARPLPDYSAFARAAEDVRRVPSFKMADPSVWLSWSVVDDAASQPTSPHHAPSDETEPKSCTDLLRRARAMEAALKDLRKSARRMAREEAKRAAAPLGPKCLPVLRRIPPGRRVQGREEVDAVLRECDGLASDVERWPP
ncbi:MAG: hypothetical protein AAGG69_12050 [Pseudomonadota bacterium]